jgi:hypothetical protein
MWFLKRRQVFIQFLIIIALTVIKPEKKEEFLGLLTLDLFYEKHCLS